MWKSIVYLRTRFPSQLNAYVVDTDYGLGIVSFAAVDDVDLSFDNELFDEVDKIDYTEMIRNVEHLLGLVDVEQGKDIPHQMGKRVSSRGAEAR